MLWTCILQVKGSDLGWETWYPDLVFSCFYSVPTAKYIYIFSEVLGFCTLFIVRNSKYTWKHNVSETGSLSVLRWWKETPSLLGPLERANLNYWKPTSHNNSYTDTWHQAESMRCSRKICSKKLCWSIHIVSRVGDIRFLTEFFFVAIFSPVKQIPRQYLSPVTIAYFQIFWDSSFILRLDALLCEVQTRSWSDPQKMRGINKSHVHWYFILLYVTSTIYLHVSSMSLN
jgi:hypothetical protein